MASDSGAARESRATPERDERADYDYRGGETERPGLEAALDERVAGDVRFDDYSRELYATDASAYEVTPVGVVFPASTEDVSSVVSYCAAREIPVLPRGGGTSLAGQAVNEAVVLDFTRYMDAVEEVDAEAATARAEAGVVLSDLNEATSEFGLKFAPDPAAGDRSALGGAIGNNSTGAHSLQYGKTDAYVESCEVVLADGTVTTLGEVTLTELRDGANQDGALLERVYAEVLRIVEEEAGEVEAQYPDLKRNVSGYNLDALVEEAREAQQDPDATVNLARLLAGSEGTLAVITEATVALEPVPETTSAALLAYDSLDAAMRDVPAILDHDAAAVELVDDVLLDLARNTAEFADVAAMLPDGTEAALLVEFYADSEDEGVAKIDELLADRVGDHAFDALEAHDDATQERFWKLRKAGLPILLSRTSDEKHISFIEDCAVPPEHLADYVADFQKILADHDTFASFYAHAGPGVLHVRPLVSTKDVSGVEAMRDIADRVTDLVVEYGGSVSGEHGDGRARTQWNRKLYGDRLWGVFRDLKTAFDPDWLLNPGQVCGDVSMTENLRFDPGYEFEAVSASSASGGSSGERSESDGGFDPALNWQNDNGMQGMAELCHGCGGCRTKQSEGGVMCPTYRAAEEESLSTRGRANALRQAMSGDLPNEQFTDEFADEIMDLCIGCKGCARDCPSEVDMAKLKTEVSHARHQRDGANLRERVFANVDELAKWGSRFAPLANRLPDLPGARAFLERTLGIARERSLPEFASESFQDWFRERGAAVAREDAERRVVLFADTYTNYANPEVGKAVVRVLEATGVHVRVADRTDSGRPAHSKGFVEQARDTARANVAELAPRVADGWDVVVPEPSDAVMFQSDLLDLCSGEDVEVVADNTYGVCEYLDTFRLGDDVEWETPGDSLTYHGHCHQKATKKDHHAVGVLRRAGYAVDPLDSGCCGMAGSFGYEAEHYSMSRAIGRLLFEQVEDSDADTVVAPGESCRTQLGDREGEGRPPHPVEKLADALD
ncbi:FAD-binding and (Fe-S)-binding domain-containing protein [Halobacterium zhouii]|uniref:FAD-binding and (Fe-S)-binding domain-containing protein n=1 Tax=Halobacterium zhouii TaxID=2902624 RepID=UPI001E5B0C3A|nr:FAD-binding and (Fe-S)-binding domain-containing protein [Halobacterium zhouii]